MGRAWVRTIPASRKRPALPMLNRSRKPYDTLSRLAKNFAEIYTELPAKDEDGYPHEAIWSKWVGEAAPSATLKDVASAVETLRAVEISPGELALLQKSN